MFAMKGMKSVLVTANCLCRLYVSMFAMKGMRSVFVTANCPCLILCYECYCPTDMYCDGCFVACFVAAMGDGRRLVPDGLVRHSVAPKFSEQPRLDPSRCISPLLGLSVMDWKFLRSIQHLLKVIVIGCL